MTLVSSIINDAFRESNILPLGAVPTTAQSTEALRLYNAMMLAIYGGDAGERLTDWPLGTYGRNPEDDDYEIPFTEIQIHNPPINQRLIAVNLTPATIYLTDRPQDGSRMGIADPFSRLAAYPLRLDGNGRPIEGTGYITLNVNGTFREWMYRADLSAWVRITDLILTSENPFPASFDMMFVILLGLRINPRYGRTLDAQSLEFLKQNRREFIARYVQSRPLEIDDSISWPFMSRQGYDTQRSFSSQRGFNRGTYEG